MPPIELTTASAGKKAEIRAALGSAASADIAQMRLVDFWVSEYVTLDSNIETGGGTDVTAALNTLFAKAFVTDRPCRFIFNGVALISDTLVVGGNTELYFLPGSGIFKKANSVGHILTNRLSGGAAMVDKSVVISGTPIFNGNEANQTSRYEDNGNGSGSIWWKVGLWFAGLSYLEMNNVEVRNSKTFALVLGGVKKARIYDYKAAWTVNDAWGENNWDAVHWWGDNPDTEIYNGESVHGDDDALAINTDENHLVDDPRRTTDPGVVNTGIIGRILVDGFKFTDTNRGIRVYNTGDATTASIGDLILRNISGDVFGSGVDQSGPATVSIYGGDVPVSRLEITNWQVKSKNNVLSGIFMENVAQANLNNIHQFTVDGITAATKIGDFYKASYPNGLSVGTSLTVGPQGPAAAVANPVQIVMGSDYSSGTPGDTSKLKFRLMPGSSHYGWGLTASGLEHHTASGTRQAFYIGGTAVVYQYIDRLEVGTKMSATIPNYADDAAADADATLLSGQFYRTTAAGRAILRKP